MAGPPSSGAFSLGISGSCLDGESLIKDRDSKKSITRHSFVGQVCEVFTPEEFFIQDADQKEMLDKLLTALDEYYYDDTKDRESLQLPVQLITEGQLCAVRWVTDQHFYRARILEAEDSQNFTLEYIDFGTQCLHQRKDMLQLHPSFKPDEGPWPQFAVKAKLDRIKPNGPTWGKETSEAFQRLMGAREVYTPVEVEVSVKRVEGDRKVVDLAFEEDGAIVDVANRLESLGLVLFEFQEGNAKKAVKSVNTELLVLLEGVSKTLQHKELDVDPSLLQEITMEHLAIAEMMEDELNSAEVDRRQKRLVQKVLGISLGQILKNPDIQRKSAEEGASSLSVRSSVAEPDVKGSRQ